MNNTDNTMEYLQREYDEAVMKHGEDSDEAKAAALEASKYLNNQG